MQASVVERVRTIAARVAGSYGLDIFDVQYRREGPGMVLRIQIDRPGSGATAEESVSVEDCARVSRDLSAVLDVEEVVPTAYTLEVSSPGLDRKLLRPVDFERFQGSRVKLTTRMPVNGNRHFEGRLEHFESGRLTLDLSGARRKHRAAEDAPQKLELELVNVEKANLVPEL